MYVRSLSKKLIVSAFESVSWLWLCIWYQECTMTVQSMYQCVAQVYDTNVNSIVHDNYIFFLIS